MITVSALPGALCAETDPELFFPPRYQALRTVRGLCAACPTRRACRRLVLELEAGKPLTHRYGVWAGLSPRQRILLDRTRSGEAAV